MDKAGLFFGLDALPRNQAKETKELTAVAYSQAEGVGPLKKIAEHLLQAIIEANGGSR